MVGVTPYWPNHWSWFVSTVLNGQKGVTVMNDLIKGITSIILISIALGQFDRLYRFARLEALKAVAGGLHPLPRFFPEGYENKRHTGVR